jgi:hypothetical protein
VQRDLKTTAGIIRICLKSRGDRGKAQYARVHRSAPGNRARSSGVDFVRISVRSQALRIEAFGSPDAVSGPMFFSNAAPQIEVAVAENDFRDTVSSATKTAALCLPKINFMGTSTSTWRSSC